MLPVGSSRVPVAVTSLCFELLSCLCVALQDGILVGAVGAYDWNGAVLKETRMGKVVPPKSSYQKEFPEELKNHGAYLGKIQTDIQVALILKRATTSVQVTTRL